ncbi:MAG: NAD-dependent epimerase/dehydratase family protein [Candidatus Yanofskybacteria bacterium]|nr:NAD-dependent epimerase/dehydratase family protein [Candidatus Yanofskybacteria bacterium]
MRILITGGAGFIGSHVVDLLIQKGYSVAIVDNLSTGKKRNINPRARFYKLDIKSPKLKEVFKKEKPKAVFHFAAQISVRKSTHDPIADAKENILGSLNVLENCVKHKVKKIIFTSTGGAMYGDAKVIPTPETYPTRPVSPYGVAKLTVEHYLHYYHKIYGLSYVALRLANVYGPRQDPFGEAGVVAIFTNALLIGKRPIIYGTGKQTRDFVFVGDVAEAVSKALHRKTDGIFNIGTGRETSVQELFSALKKITASKQEVRRGPDRLGEQERSCLECGEAENVLGWNPQNPLEQGLRETVDFMRIQSSSMRRESLQK